MNNQPSFYPYSIKINNRIYDPYAKLCFPDVAKNINVKVFNLMSRTNETRHIEWHEICECECDKSCDIGEYLYYKNCKCRKKLLIS